MGEVLGGDFNNMKYMHILASTYESPPIPHYKPEWPSVG